MRPSCAKPISARNGLSPHDVSTTERRTPAMPPPIKKESKGARASPCKPVQSRDKGCFVTALHWSVPGLSRVDWRAPARREQLISCRINWD